MLISLDAPPARCAGRVARLRPFTAGGHTLPTKQMDIGRAPSRITDLAFGPLDRDSASTLANFLDLLSNVIPPWAPVLERPRIAALLAA